MNQTDVLPGAPFASSEPRAESWGRRLIRSLLRRKGGGARPATIVPGMMSPWGFAAALDRSLGLLGGAKVGITLFAVSHRGAGAGGEGEGADIAIDTFVVAALSPLGVVGRLPDGRIGLGYLGPGGEGGEAAERLIASVHGRVASRLIEEGRSAEAERLEIAAVHARTDRIRSAARLIAGLPEAS